MKRLLQVMMMIMGMLSATAFLSSPARADTIGGVTCNPYLLNGNAWPGDGTHAFLCFTPGSKEEPAVSVFQVIEHLPYQANPGTAVYAGNILRTKGYIGYYFKTRPDAIAYLTGKYGSSSQVVVQATTARCGATGYDQGIMGMGRNLVTSVWAYCHYQNPVPTGGADSVINPGVGPTTAHESGHAYDFAIAAITNGTTYPSRSVGFNNLAIDDIQKGGRTVCGSFDGTTPSQLETQLGAKYATPVCNGSTILAPYTGQSVKTILQEETPYFTNPGTSKQFFEIWAEDWARTAASGQASILPFMDYTIGTSQLFSCVGTVMFALDNYGKLPNAIGQAYPSYCTNPDGSPVTDAQITTSIP